MRLAWMLPVLLTACSFGASDNSPQALCERQAYDDPAVREIIGNSAGNYMDGGPQRDQMLWAVRQGTQRCLQKKGLAPPGGVEPVRPTS